MYPEDKIVTEQEAPNWGVNQTGLVEIMWASTICLVSINNFISYNNLLINPKNQLNSSYLPIKLVFVDNPLSSSLFIISKQKISSVYIFFIWFINSL